MKAKKSSLRDLFAAHTGKVSDKWDIYISEYDRLFQPYRDQPVRLLEIGIQNGGSLEIWSKYFTNAKKIVGCDIEPLCMQLSFDDVKIAVVVADANTDVGQSRILEQSSSFDVIIDDGSHKSSDIIKSFARYFYHLEDGGLYIAEDLHCSYWLDFEGGLYHPYSSIAFFKRLADTVNHEHWGVEQSRNELMHDFANQFDSSLTEVLLEHVHSIEFINSICVVRKQTPRKNKLGERLITGEVATVWESAASLNGVNSTPQNQRQNQWSFLNSTFEVQLNIRAEEINRLNIQLNEHQSKLNLLSQTSKDQKELYESQIARFQQKLKTQALTIIETGKEFAQQLLNTQQLHTKQLNDQDDKHLEKENKYLSQLAHAHQVIETQLQQAAQREENFLLQSKKIQIANSQQHDELVCKYLELEKKYVVELVKAQQVIDTQNSLRQQQGKEFSQQLYEIELTHAKLANKNSLDYAAREHELNARINAMRADFLLQKNGWAEKLRANSNKIIALQIFLSTLLKTRSYRLTASIRNLASIFQNQDSASSLSKIATDLESISVDLEALLPSQIVEQTSSLNTNKYNKVVDMSLTNFDLAVTSLADLLSHQDEQFIFSAYRTLLGRVPDPDGLSYYLTRLRAGIDKHEIVAQLRLSKEGKHRVIKLDGLEQLLRTHKRQKRFIFNAIGNKSRVAAQNLRAVENKFYLLNEQVKKSTTALNESIRRIENSIHNQERTQIQPARHASESLSATIFANKTVSDKFPNEANNSNQKKNILLSTGNLDLDTVSTTVAILTKNPGAIFKEVLKAALNQDVPWKYEVLVIDSGSSDGTIEFIRLHSGVRLIEIKSTDFGHGRTRNLAVSMAKGKYVAMLTHDAKPLNNKWLINLVAPLEANASVAGVFGRHKAYPEHSHYIKRDMEMHFNGFLEWPAVMGIEDPERYEREQGYRQVLHFFSDNNACLRKEVWSKIPYPDVNFAEDQLWAKAIIEAGYKRAYADDAVVYHSHDYSIRDTFRRSFDESRALKTLFGYDLCPSAGHGVYQAYACAKSDLNFLSKSVGIRNAFGLAFKTPFLHMSKQIGWYIGRYQGQLKTVLFWLFSLDGAKKRQSNMSFSNKIKSFFYSTKDHGNSSSPRFDQQPIVEVSQQAPAHNKTDVIGFYDFVITKDAGTLPVTSKVFEEKTINWFIPDFGIGSGGHLNIFRFIQMLEKDGYKSTICIVGAHKHASPFQARALISEHFFKLQAEVVLGVENLAPSCYSFATSWITAYALKGFGATLHKLYFVQDFEPAFYSHGSEYDFSEETYKFGFTGVCAGKWLAHKLKSDYGMKCHTIGFSYDRDLYQQTHRREPHKQRVFCYCRPPTVRRGWESAMLALSLVGQKMPDVEFIFAGWDMGNYHFPYEHLNAGVCSLKELPDLFSQCDAALVFSFTNLSLLPLELMSCGCVVVSNRAPNTEWLLNDDNSVLPKSSSPRAIADAIIDVLTDTKKRTGLATRAKKFASSTSWEVEGKRLEKVLIELDQ
jgi:O-antigen biosynthesis protein